MAVQCGDKLSNLHFIAVESKLNSLILMDVLLNIAELVMHVTRLISAITMAI